MNEESTELHSPDEPDANAEYRKEYSEDAFWAKTKFFARAAGRHVMERAMQMYYAAQDKATPAWARATIYGALGYFIVPLDAISDFAPVVGFSDDLGVLAFAIAVVAAHITPEIKEKAAQKLLNWFPQSEEPEQTEITSEDSKDE